MNGTRVGLVLHVTASVGELREHTGSARRVCRARGIGATGGQKSKREGESKEDKQGEETAQTDPVHTLFGEHFCLGISISCTVLVISTVLKF